MKKKTKKKVVKKKAQKKAKPAATVPVPVYNYAVVRGFLNTWVGRTKLPVDGKRIFGNLEAAIGEARSIMENEIENEMDLECAIDELNRTLTGEDPLEDAPDKDFSFKGI